MLAKLFTIFKKIKIISLAKFVIAWGIPFIFWPSFRLLVMLMWLKGTLTLCSVSCLLWSGFPKSFIWLHSSSVVGGTRDLL